MHVMDVTKEEYARMKLSGVDKAWPGVDGKTVLHQQFYRCIVFFFLSLLFKLLSFLNLKDQKLDIQ